MKVKLIVLFLLLIFSLFHSVKAQKVFSTKSTYEAEIKVFVVEFASQADLLVCEVDDVSQAEKNEGRWFFVHSENAMAKKICFIDNAFQADLRVYFVKNCSQAGWQNRAKKPLMQ